VAWFAAIRENVKRQPAVRGSACTDEATTVELDAGHLSPVFHRRQIADLIVAAAGWKR
jgi:hypothetical protein